MTDNKQRERLIELLEYAAADVVLMRERDARFMAERLIRRGVIVPPVAVGQTVYYPVHYREIDGSMIRGIAIEAVAAVGDACFSVYEDWTEAVPYSALGEEFFLTREEAEAKLKEMEGQKE